MGMPRQRTGQIVERVVTRKQKGKKAKKVTLVYARVSFKDGDGKVKERWRLAETRSDAKEIIKKLHTELDTHGPGPLSHSNSTFTDLATKYREKILVAPTYPEGPDILQRDDVQKLSGQRAWRNARSFLKPLEAYFGSDPGACGLSPVRTCLVCFWLLLDTDQGNRSGMGQRLLAGGSC